jgi:hypothetical protein
MSFMCCLWVIVRCVTMSQQRVAACHEVCISSSTAAGSCCRHKAPFATQHRVWVLCTSIL